KLIRLAQFVEHQPAIFRADHNRFLALAQNNFPDADFSRSLQSFAQQCIRLRAHRTIRTRKVRRIIQRRRNLSGIDKTFDLDDLGALQFYLPDIIGRDDHVLLRLKLITLHDLIRRQSLAAFLALLLVTDRAVIFLVQLIEANRLLSIHRVVNPDRNRNERELNVTFPDGAHKSVSLVIQEFRARSGRSRTKTGSLKSPSLVNEANWTSHTSLD